jgi:cysteine desulfurase/selenocysteine lyase
VIHFNNAGAALPPQVVLDTIISYLNREAEIGGYEAAAEASERLDAVYDSIAELLGASPHQIASIENATRAWDMAVYGYPFQPGDRVLTARAEYVSNVIALLQLQKHHGIEIVLIEDDEAGQISLEHLDQELAKGAAMVALTHAPTSGGLINPAEEVGVLCHKYGVFYVLDGCQSAGQVPIDVGRIGCDVLSGTGRKNLRGPRGTGDHYRSDRALEILEPPFLDLHSASWTGDRRYEIRPDAKRFETWETYYAGKLGLGAAVDHALALGVENTWPRIRALGGLLRTMLDELDGVTTHDLGVVQGGIVTFSVDGKHSADIQRALSALGCNTSVSPSENARFDLLHRRVPSPVRASVHYYNTEDEVERFVDSVTSLATQ